MSDTTRRALLAGVAGIGTAVAVGACGGGSTSGGGATTTPGAAQTTAGGTASGLAPASEIPVGGGKVFSAQKVVVTQPTAGSFKAFTAICTHHACIVGEVSGGKIKCPCHGSQYSIT